MEESSKRLAHAFLQGDIHSSWQIVQEHINQGMNSYYIYEHLLSKAMYSIGDMWEENIITVADEHIATGVCDFILSRYAFNHINTNNHDKRAMFFCVEGEEHFLGIKMVNALFQENGWDVRFLGPNLPLEYALYSIQNFKPHVVGISVSLSTQLPQLEEYVNKINSLKERPDIIIGSRLGPMLSIFENMPNVHFIHSLQEIRAWFEEVPLQLSN
ncbi:cobalamin B12-binding domain-containing protein [Bacillus suaedae]|uniref:Cobalamin-dependent protein n=1 Tax=Halalkalibacter suaedae TaxID=2822140 RepID=A0A940WXF2_9BACI|nr:cobalamin-dependent protein [Bacillus suaedae]MBP3949599.1 cobalamin-dependent protein [Bacillus suaedae]